MNGPPVVSFRAAVQERATCPGSVSSQLISSRAVESDGKTPLLIFVANLERVADVTESGNRATGPGGRSMVSHRDGQASTLSADPFGAWDDDTRHQHMQRQWD